MARAMLPLRSALRAAKTVSSGTSGKRSHAARVMASASSMRPRRSSVSVWPCRASAESGATDELTGALEVAALQLHQALVDERFDEAGAVLERQAEAGVGGLQVPLGQ